MWIGWRRLGEYLEIIEVIQRTYEGDLELVIVRRPTD